MVVIIIMKPLGRGRRWLGFVYHWLLYRRRDGAYARHMIDGRKITGIRFWYRSANIPLITVRMQAKTYGGAVMACALAAENPRLLILVTKSV